MSPQEDARVVWHIAPRSSYEQATSLLDKIDAAVLSGVEGNVVGRRLRADRQFGGDLWLDLRGYEERVSQSNDTLFGDRRLHLQQELEVTDILSPGGLVTSLCGLKDALVSQQRWLDGVGGGRVLLALEAEFVRDCPDEIIDAFTWCHYPVAITLKDSGLPFDRSGVAEATAMVVEEVPDMFVLRADLGAIGAVACGARLGAIGNRWSGRKVHPKGSSGGGGSPPSVFVEELLTFRSAPDTLSRLPPEASFTCGRPCCGDRQLQRFVGMRSDSEPVLEHNATVMAAVIERVTGPSVDPMLDRFGDLCRAALEAHLTLALVARQRLTVHRHLERWSEAVEKRRGRPRTPAQ